MIPSTTGLRTRRIGVCLTTLDPTALRGDRRVAANRVSLPTIGGVLDDCAGGVCAGTVERGRRLERLCSRTAQVRDFLC